MCGTPAFMKPPEIPSPPPLPEAPKPGESLKQVTDDASAGRAQAMRRLAAKASLASTNKTGPMGITAAAPVAFKTLLGS